MPIKLNLKNKITKAATISALALGTLATSTVVLNNKQANADTINQPVTSKASHFIKYGDTLGDIAKANNTTVAKLAEINHISNVDLIFAGQTLVLPDGTTATVAAPTAATSAQTQAPVATPTPAPAKPAAQPAAQAQTPVQPVAQAQAPVQQQVAQPAQQATAPTQSTKQVTAPAATPTTSTNSQNDAQPAASSSDQDAMNYIIQGESGGNSSVYGLGGYGLFQLSPDKLGNDLSVAHQYQVANAYAQSRYGGWANAKAHWQTYRSW